MSDFIKRLKLTKPERALLLKDEPPRLLLAEAVLICRDLMQLWGMNPLSCTPVGSIRRRRETIGDIDLLAPWEPKEHDALYQRISATLTPPAGGLFAAAPVESIGTEISGVKPGFLCASMQLHFRGRDVKVQVWRYTPENLGWQLIKCTGPGGDEGQNYGRWFLTQWKKRFEIPFDDAHKASIDGYLVDANQERVPVASEAEAFAKCGIKPCPPDRREAFMAHIGRMTPRDYRPPDEKPRPLEAADDIEAAQTLENE